MKPSAYALSEHLDFNFTSQTQLRANYEPDSTLRQFYEQTRWPQGDIDIFLYGLSAAQAETKLHAVFAKLRRTALLPPHGSVQDECVFVKTPNTVTMVSAEPRRKVGSLARLTIHSRAHTHTHARSCADIVCSDGEYPQARARSHKHTHVHTQIQIITRLYETKDDILNGFDIDCCAVGWDGTECLMTDRCIRAVSERVNTINLDIRGEAYENMKRFEKVWKGLKRFEKV